MSDKDLHAYPFVETLLTLAIWLGALFLGCESSEITDPADDGP